MTQAPINQPLDALSDEQLWEIIDQRETFSSANQPDLEALVDAYDQYVFRRSQALLLLKQRGYEVEKRLKLGT